MAICQGGPEKGRLFFRRPAGFKSLHLLSMYRFLALLLLLATPANAVVIDQVVAVVGDQVITLSELNDEWKIARATPQDPPITRAELLSRMIDLELQMIRARKMGLTPTNADVEQAIADIIADNHLPSMDALEQALAGEGKTIAVLRKEITRQMSLMRLLQREVKGQVRVGDAETRAYYHAHPEAFTPPDTVQLRQIIFSLDGLSQADRGQAVAAIGRVREQVSDKGSFRAAERRLKGTEGVIAGRAGEFSITDLHPAIAAAVSGLSEGEVSGLVPLPTGLGLFLLDRRYRDAPAPFEQVADQARELATAEATQKRLTEWVASLKTHTPVVIKPYD